MTAIPELLDVLALEDCIVTIDAIGAQTKIARSIVEHDADYVLSVKANQATLLDDIRLVFHEDQAHHFQEDPTTMPKRSTKVMVDWNCANSGAFLPLCICSVCGMPTTGLR
jgi:predicted transposase YbfD/YdcC